jgi:hypothetical protein
MMRADNTGSWYQNVYLGRSHQPSVSYPPIAWFRVCSDLLDVSRTLSVENLDALNRLLLSVTSTTPCLKLASSVESLDSSLKYCLTVANNDACVELVLSVENTD